MTRDTTTRLDDILGALRAGILAVDVRGVVEFQNSEASRILGVSARRALGRPLAEVLSPDHPVTGLLLEALEGARDVTANGVHLPWRLGTEPPVVDLAASPVPSGGVCLVLHDRTISQELQDLVEQETRSEVFAHLAAGIAHELRNPLGGIRGAAELLLDRIDDPLRRFPEMIREEADRMRRLLDDLAELTRAGDLTLAPTNLHGVLDNLIDLQVNDPLWEGIEVERSYDPSIPELFLDADRIAQVFLNLLRNAVQALGGKGELVVRTRVEAGYHLALGPEAMHIVRVDVEDDGPGIPEQDLPHIFTPFFSRRKSGGSGLGLAVAHSWVVQHGGRIHVSSRHGHGTRMRVLLPLRRPA